MADLVARAQASELAEGAQRSPARLAAGLDAARLARKTRARTRRNAWRCVAAGGMALAAWLSWLGVREPRPLAFEVGLAREKGVIGARLEAPSSGTLPLHFTDGTELMLGKNSSALVVGLEPRGAHVVLQRGEVQATVIPRPRGAWVFAVGPFDVHVKGTRFATSWDAQRESFHLRMYEGAVLLTSRCLSAPREAAAGDVLELRCPTAVAMVGPTASVPSPLPAAPRVVSSEATAHAPTAASRPRGPARIRATAALDDPGRLAALCESASADALFELGAGARARSQRAVAVRIYEAIRRRFPGSDAAALAAFHLGQVAFDQGGTLAVARLHFMDYLAERPVGELVQQALGRLLEIERALASPNARQRAADYLVRFPAGPHAALARSLALP
ncbi:MAG TPA: FecR domain-containing protein [Polyangia bacterium]